MTGISDLVEATESVQDGFLGTPEGREPFLVTPLPPAAPVSSGSDAWSMSVAFPSSSAETEAAAAAAAACCCSCRVFSAARFAAPAIKFEEVHENVVSGAKDF